jgi:hypothetical protein
MPTWAFTVLAEGEGWHGRYSSSACMNIWKMMPIDAKAHKKEMTNSTTQATEHRHASA